MTNKKLKLIVTAALFAALTCVATMIIQIPSPMNGYVNLGDCFALLSGWILGPVYGFLSAGIGSMLADLLSGYAHYAPGTLLIKGGVALIAALLYPLLKKIISDKLRISRIVSSIAAEIFMVVGYFFYAGLLLGKGFGAAASIPGNIVQGIVAVITSVLLMEVLAKTKIFKDM